MLTESAWKGLWNAREPVYPTRIDNVEVICRCTLRLYWKT